MSRILLCWELGGNLGHLMRLLPVARGLRLRGHEVIWALPGNQPQALALVQAEGFAGMLGPAWSTGRRDASLSQTYGQNLLRNGYHHRESLAQHLLAWRGLIQALKPDRLIAEHAPTALLATRATGLPRVAMGTGFSLPPPASPMPGLAPWFSLPPNRLQEHETTFLETVNPALAAAGMASLGQVAEIFAETIPCLCTWAEFDHYPARADAAYLGPVIHSAEGCEPLWPAAGRQNGFVYLRAGHRLFPQLMAALERLGLPVLAFVPDFQGTEGLQGAGIRITRRPLDLRELEQHCRFAVTEGGHNTGIQMLLKGIPTLLCPAQLEQAIWSYQLQARGLCDMISLFDPSPDLPGKLARLETLASAEPLNNLVRRHAGAEPERTLHQILEQCLL